MRGFKKILFKSVGTTYVEKEITSLPRSIVVTRVKATVVSGTTESVGLVVRTRSGTTNADYIPLEYDLVEKLDYFERSVIACKMDNENKKGSLFLAVKGTTTGNNISVTLEYEM